MDVEELRDHHLSLQGTPGDEFHYSGDITTKYMAEFKTLGYSYQCPYCKDLYLSVDGVIHHVGAKCNRRPTYLNYLTLKASIVNINTGLFASEFTYGQDHGFDAVNQLHFYSQYTGVQI